MAVMRARRVAVPPTIRADGAVASPDYAWAVEVPVRDAGSWTPERWARAVFEGAPAPLPRVLVLGWTLVLGLRLGPRPSPGHVLGWAVTGSGPDRVTLEARSWLVVARNVVAVGDVGVVWVTFVRHRRWAARPVWAVLAPVHQVVVPALLRRAERSHADNKSSTRG